MEEVEALKKLEGLAVRKASLYGRVLTDIRLAEAMQELAKFHEDRKNSLAELMGEETSDEA